MSYHDQEHYSSVRDKQDNLFSAAKPIELNKRIKIATAENKETSGSHGSSSSKQKQLQAANSKSEKIVAESTGCYDFVKIRQLLESVWDDTAAAIEIILADKHLNNNPEQKQQKTDDLSQASSAEQKQQTSVSVEAKSDSSLCKCGSGKKLKKCCEKNDKYLAALDAADTVRGPKRSKQTRSESSTSNNVDPVSKHAAKLTNRQRKEANKAEKDKEKPSSNASSDKSRTDGIVDLASDFGSISI
jgi:hypothetical protein